MDTFLWASQPPDNYSFYYQYLSHSVQWHLESLEEMHDLII